MYSPSDLSNMSDTTSGTVKILIIIISFATKYNKTITTGVNLLIILINFRHGWGNKNNNINQGRFKNQGSNNNKKDHNSHVNIILTK